MLDPNNPLQNPNYGTPYSPSNYGYYSANPYNQQKPIGMRSVNEQTPVFNWIRVNNVEEVKSYHVKPGEQAWFMFQEEPVFAVKTCDNVGLANTKYFKFEQIDLESKNTSKENDMSIKMFDSINASILEMQNKIDSLIKEVNKLKGGKSNGKSSNASAESDK